MASLAISAEIAASGTATAFSDEATTNTSGRIYQITDADKRILDPTDTYTVEDNAVAIDAAHLSFYYLFGTVEIAAGYGVITGPITISGDYLPQLAIATANKFTVKTVRDIKEATPFHASDVHKKKNIGMRDATGTFGVLDFSQTDFDSGGGVVTLDSLLEGVEFVLSAQHGATGLTFRAWATIPDFVAKTPVKDLVTTDVNWRSTPQLDSDGQAVSGFAWSDEIT